MAVEEQIYVVVNFEEVRFMVAVAGNCTIKELRSEIENIAGKEYPQLREKKVAVIQNCVRADLLDRFNVKEILQGNNEVFAFSSVDSAKSSSASVNSLACASTPSGIKRHRDSIDTEISWKCGKTLKSNEVKTKSILDESNKSKKKGKLKKMLKVLTKELVKDSASETEEVISDKSSVYNCDERINQSIKMRNSPEINGQMKEHQVVSSSKDKVEDTSHYCNTEKGEMKSGRCPQETENTLYFPTPPISPEMSNLPLVASVDQKKKTRKESNSKWVKYYRSAKNVVTWLANQEDHLSKQSQEEQGNCDVCSDTTGGQEKNVKTECLLRDKCNHLIHQEGEANLASQQSDNSSSKTHQESSKDEIDKFLSFPVIDFNRKKVIYFDARPTEEFGNDGMLFERALKLPQIALPKLHLHKEYEGGSWYVYVSCNNSFDMTDEPTQASKAPADVTPNLTEGKKDDDGKSLGTAKSRLTGAKLKRRTKGLMEVVERLHLQKKVKTSCCEAMHDGITSVDSQGAETPLERDPIQERTCSVGQRSEELGTTTVEDNIRSIEPLTFMSENQNKENDTADAREKCELEKQGSSKDRAAIIVQNRPLAHAEDCDEIGLASGSSKKKEKSQKKRKRKLEMKELVKLGKEDKPEKESPELETKDSIRKDSISAAVNASKKEERRGDECSLDIVPTEDQHSVKQEKSRCSEMCKLNSNLKDNFKLRIKFCEKKIPKAQKSGDLVKRETVENSEEQTEISTSNMQIPIESVKQSSSVCGKKERKPNGLHNRKRDIVVYEETEESPQLDDHPVELENVLKRSSKKRKLRRKKNRNQRDLKDLSLRTECEEVKKNLKDSTESTNEVDGTGVLKGNEKTKAARKRKLKKKKSARSIITVSPRTDLQTEENHESVESSTQEGVNDTQCLDSGGNKRKKKKKKKKLKTYQQEGSLHGLEKFEDVQQSSLEQESTKMYQNVDNKKAFLTNTEFRGKVVKERNSKIAIPASTEVNLDIDICKNELEKEEICKNSNHENIETENCILGESRNSSASLECSRSKKKKHKKKRKQIAATNSAEESFSGLVGLSNVQHNSHKLKDSRTQRNIEDNENLLTNTEHNKKVVKEKKLKNISPVCMEVDLGVCENGSRQEGLFENSNHENLETKNCIFRESKNSSGKSIQGKIKSKRKKPKGEEKQETAAMSLEFNKKEVEQLNPVLECGKGVINKSLQVNTKRKRFSSCSSLEDFQTAKKRKRMPGKLSLKKDLLKDFNGVDVIALPQEKKDQKNKGEDLQTKNEKEEKSKQENTTEEMFSNTEDDSIPVPHLNKVVERALKACSTKKSGNKPKCQNSFLDLVEDDLTMRKKERRKEYGSRNQFSTPSTPSFIRRLSSPPKGFIDSSHYTLPKKKNKKIHTPVSLVTKRTKSTNVCNAKRDLSLQEKELFDLGTKDISALLMDDSLWE